MEKKQAAKTNDTEQDQIKLQAKYSIQCYFYFWKSQCKRS